MVRNIQTNVDDYLLNSTIKDIDDFFEHQRVYLYEYYIHIKNATSKADRMTQAHKSEFANIYTVCYK